MIGVYSVKFYFCPVIGIGSIDDPMRPSISHYTSSYRAVDARAPDLLSGYMMVECVDISQHQHQIAMQDGSITYFDTAGLSLDDSILPLTNREDLKDKMASFGLTIGDLTEKSTLRDVMKHVTLQLLKVQNPKTTNTVTHYDN